MDTVPQDTWQSDVTRPTAGGSEMHFKSATAGTVVGMHVYLHNYGAGEGPMQFRLIDSDLNVLFTSDEITPPALGTWAPFVFTGGTTQVAADTTLIWQYRTRKADGESLLFELAVTPIIESVPQIAQVFPTQCTIWASMKSVLVGNAVAINVQPAQAYNCRPYQNASANGDSCQSRFYLAAGEYKMRVLGAYWTGNGIVDWYIDDVIAVAGQDWYAAGSIIPNAVQTSTVTVATSGTHTLKSVINGKNASAVGYSLTWTVIDFRPSGD
jgi:hypothetical protein